MKINTIILAHFKERKQNLKRIVDDLFASSVKPSEVTVFIDNPDIKFEDDRCTIIFSSQSFLPIIRFALGSISDADYCFFIDDDLSVNKKTIENFTKYADDDSILGLQGSVLGSPPTPYTKDYCINRGIVQDKTEVDIVIRTYFVPVKCLMAGLKLRAMYPKLPKRSLDDVFLCLGNKYLNKNKNYVIPIDKDSDLIELNEGGVGQCHGGDHYKNRDFVCNKLMEKYDSSFFYQE